jgi:hypothetical protein
LDKQERMVMRGHKGFRISEEAYTLLGGFVLKLGSSKGLRDAARACMPRGVSGGGGERGGLRQDHHSMQQQSLLHGLTVNNLVNNRQQGSNRCRACLLRGERSG